LTQPNWLPVGGPITATNATMTAFPAVGTNSQAFFRVVLLP
jgi:hypothetical protein